ncbi:hypothetical protein D3C84_442670 [compost metagenome]
MLPGPSAPKPPLKSPAKLVVSAYPRVVSSTSSEPASAGQLLTVGESSSTLM